MTLLHSVELHCTSSSSISNCRHLKSAIFISRNINYYINSLLRLHVEVHMISLSLYICVCVCVCLKLSDNITNRDTYIYIYYYMYPDL